MPAGLVLVLVCVVLARDLRRLLLLFFLLCVDGFAELGRWLPRTVWSARRRRSSSSSSLSSSPRSSACCACHRLLPPLPPPLLPIVPFHFDRWSRSSAPCCLRVSSCPRYSRRLMRTPTAYLHSLCTRRWFAFKTLMAIAFHHVGHHVSLMKEVFGVFFDEATLNKLTNEVEVLNRIASLAGKRA